jgi:phosphoglycolate phosphatase-like HAD superfamily hydrolase
VIELIIFDLDGTLVDSSVDITNALNFAIEPFHLEKVPTRTAARRPHRALLSH